MTINSLISIVLTCGLILGATASRTEAGIYRWQDKNGHWHFSDSPTSDDKGSQPMDPEPAPSQPGRTSPPPPKAPQNAPATPPANVQPPAKAPSARESEPPAPAAQTIQGGLLWRISKNGQPHSYLLGTIHSADPRVTRLKPTVSQALEKSDRFIMEMELDTMAIMQFGATMMLGQDEDLEAVLGAPLFSRVVTAMDGKGMPEMVVRQLKPWVVMAILSMPPTSGRLILDMVLRQRASARGKPVSGLETAQEQLAVFEGLSREDQVELLELTIDQLPSQPALLEQMITAYAADDLGRITNIAQRHNTRVPSQAAMRFMRRLNDDRNVRMAQRIVPYLEQTNSFIAVGALHLAGEKGILALLRRQGYETTSIR